MVSKDIEYIDCQALDPNNLEYEFLADLGCVQYIFIEESLEEEPCISNGYRALEVISSESLNSCYNSCLDCNN